MYRALRSLATVAVITLGAVGTARAQMNQPIQQMSPQFATPIQPAQYTQVAPTSPSPTAPPIILGTTEPTQSAIQSMNPEDVKRVVDAYLKEQDAKKKEAEAAAKKKAEDEGYKVGTDLTLKTTWKDGFTYNTPNNDFYGHIGGWMQWDNVWWNQSSLLQVPIGPRAGPAQGVASGANLGGIGDLQDGTYFRRLRIMLDGGFWENYEYTLIFALENSQFNMVGLDEFWVGFKDLPLLNTVRLGHVKTPMGLEADMTGSSRTMTFMERSSYSEAIELNQNFVTGIWFSNNYCDQRSTWSFAAFRSDPGSSTGEFFGDGQWGWQGRLTALPVYENDGRCLMHVGLSGGWRNGSNTIATSPLHVLQLRARPELRDDTPPGGFANGDPNRMVDTGNMALERDWLMGLEYLHVVGPLSVQAEYGWNWVENVKGFSPLGFVLNPALATPQNYMFSGGYLQLAYTLTGEHRSYDKRLGRLDSYYYGRSGPFNNFWCVRDDNCCINCNTGAWEVAVRYSYVNLNDGLGLNRVQGGVMDGWTAGLNWMLNNNMKFQFNYVHDQRHDVPTGTFPGQVSGFGMRMQFMF